MGFKRLALFTASFALLLLSSALPARAFTQVIVFGDSLSDDGNVAHRTRDTVGFSYPSSNFNYSDYRFTNDFNTDPPARLYQGTWHEQLARTFLQLPPGRNSLDGGTDYAFGGATTEEGTQQRTIINNPTPFGGGDYTITIDNIGKQINDYLATHRPDANALYVLWGGGNDLFDDDSSANVVATANRVGGLIQRLARAGARNFLVPNVPPLGAVPSSFGDPTKVAELDAASYDYRNQLYTLIASTKSTLAASGISINVYTLDVWLNTLRLLAEPRRYGLIDVIDPAQGQSVNPDQYLYWDDIHPTTAGHYQIAKQASRLLNGQIPALGRATNISTRGWVGPGDNALIGGFIISGTQPKKVIVRAIGPSLSSFGVPGVLVDPKLTIFNSRSEPIAANDDWQSSQASEINASGRAPADNRESAIVLSLPPGTYTAVVTGKAGATGIALVDLYDLDAAANSTFRNVSTRGFVSTGDNVLIGGLSIASGEPPVVILRAIGPSLGSYGIAQPLQDPTLELHNANGALLAFNDDWESVGATAKKAALLAPGDARESAIILSLSAGNYTAIVRGKSGATGIALVEAYRR